MAMPDRDPRTEGSEDAAAISQIRRAVGNTPNAASYADTLSEHRRLRLLVGRVRLVAHNDHRLDDTLWRRIVASELQQLGDVLLRHFANEEAGGYFADVTQEKPRLAGRVRELEAEHGLMADELDALTTIAHAHDVSDLRRRVVALLDTLERHERSENLILQEAVVVDLGG